MNIKLKIEDNKLTIEAPQDLLKWITHLIEQTWPTYKPLVDIPQATQRKVDSQDVGKLITVKTLEFGEDKGLKQKTRQATLIGIVIDHRGIEHAIVNKNEQHPEDGIQAVKLEDCYIEYIY